MCLFFRMGMYLFSFREMVGGANVFFVHKQTNDNLKKKTTQIKAQKSEKVIHHRYDLRGEEEGKQSRIFFSKYIVIIFKLMSFFVTLIDI